MGINYNLIYLKDKSSLTDELLDLSDFDKQNSEVYEFLEEITSLFIKGILNKMPVPRKFSSRRIIKQFKLIVNSELEKTRNSALARNAPAPTTAEFFSIIMQIFDKTSVAQKPDLTI